MKTKPKRVMQTSARSGPASPTPADNSSSATEPKEQKPELSEHDQTRLAMAALFAALARSLRDQGMCDLERFDEEIERLHYEMGEEDSPPLAARRTLRWTHKYLRLSKLE
jgi:hypothetical protein